MVYTDELSPSVEGEFELIILRPTMMRIVQHLYRNPERVTWYITELARELGLSFMTTLRNVRKLEKAQVIQKVPNRIDKRVIFYYLDRELTEKLLAKYRRHVALVLYKLIPWNGIRISDLLKDSSFANACGKWGVSPQEGVDVLRRNTRKIGIKQVANGWDLQDALFRREQ